MKKIAIIIIFLLTILILGACGGETEPLPEHSEIILEPERTFEYEYLTFEDTLLEFATDVVVAQYVRHRLFSDNITEFEFVVSERILGNAADRIFIYVRHTNANVSGGEMNVTYEPGDLVFSPGVEYLLPLTAINSPYAMTHEDGFVFIRNIVVNLDDPQSSIMYSEPLYLHIEGLDFNSRSNSRHQIEVYVENLTRDIISPREVIRSERIEDIILGSPYVLVVEISDPFRLSDRQGVTDVMRTDIYNATIIQVLKGTIEIGNLDGEFAVIFFADTVLPGEQHIVAVSPIEEGSPWFEFTSRNSLFHMDQLDEILTILGQ